MRYTVRTVAASAIVSQFPKGSLSNRVHYLESIYTFPILSTHFQVTILNERELARLEMHARLVGSVSLNAPIGSRVFRFVILVPWRVAQTTQRHWPNLELRCFHNFCVTSAPQRNSFFCCSYVKAYRRSTYGATA